MDTQHEDSGAQELASACSGPSLHSRTLARREEMCPAVSFPVVSDARAIPAKNNSEKKELLNHYKHSYFAKRAKLKKKCFKSITVIEMCRLKYFVTVCGNVPSHIMKGPSERDFSQGTCKPALSRGACLTHPGRCHNTRLPGAAPMLCPGGTRPQVSRDGRGFPLERLTPCLPFWLLSTPLKSWNLKGKLAL